MPRYLSIDTSTEACSAALSIDGEIRERYAFAPRRHAELILGMVEALLREAGVELPALDGVAFGRGPGAFTGVRIAAGVAQGLAFGAGLPVVPVSTLAALAQGAVKESPLIMSAIDARMQEIYWGLFQRTPVGLVQSLAEERVDRPADVQLPREGNWFGAGSGWGRYGDTLREGFGARLTGMDGERFPHARDILSLALPEFAAGRAVPPHEALPVYLRNRVTG